MQSGGIDDDRPSRIRIPRGTHLVFGSILPGKHFIPGKNKFCETVCSRKHRFWEAKRVRINFQLDGTIVAPTENEAWGKGLLQWLEFTKLRGITIQGQGTIDGRGSVWWEDYPFDDPIDDETRFLIPLNSSVERNPPMPVTFLNFILCMIRVYHH